MEPPKQKSFQLRTGEALRIEKEIASTRPTVPPVALAQPTTPRVQPAAPPATPHFHTFRPLKMEGKAKRPLATSPQVARVLKLVNKPEEFEEPSLKKKKMMTAPKAMVPVKTIHDQLASFLSARRTSLKPIVKTVEEAKAYIANELVAMKPLNMAPLSSVGATSGIAIPIESISFEPLGSNIQHILDDIELEMDSKNSIGIEHERARRPVLEGAELLNLSHVAEKEHRIQDVTPTGA